MKTIVTLTLNPAIDGSCDAPRVRPTRKIRTTNTRYDPGGGGINVARVVKRFGGNVRAIYLAGGATGGVLDGLLDRDSIVRTRIDIAGHTRISQAVHELETGLEYRFVPDGPEVSESEWQACLAAMDGLDCNYLVLSGSLPRGVPVDFYARIVVQSWIGCPDHPRHIRTGFAPHLGRRWYIPGQAKSGRAGAVCRPEADR